MTFTQHLNLFLKRMIRLMSQTGRGWFLALDVRLYERHGSDNAKAVYAAATILDSLACSVDAS